MRRLASALLVLIACRRAQDEARPRPADVLAPRPLKVRYAAKTDNAADGTNSTFFSIVEDDVLFVVGDAADPAESKRAVEALSAYPPAGCPGGGQAQLACAVDRVKGAASIAAVIVADRQAYVVTSGDVVVLHRRGAALSPIAGRATLAAADTLVIASRALRAASDDAAILRATPDRASPITALETGLETLIVSAGHFANHGPLTAIFIHAVDER